MHLKVIEVGREVLPSKTLKKHRKTRAVRHYSQRITGTQEVRTQKSAKTHAFFEVTRKNGFKTRFFPHLSKKVA